MSNHALGVIDQPYEIKRSLDALGLTSDQIIKIGMAAAIARSEYLEGVDPVNYPGTQAYQAGIRHLRLETLPSGWRTGNFRNIEIVVNDDLGIMLGFQNVDHACKDIEPQAISPKGEATRDLVAAPHAQSLFPRADVVDSRPGGSFPVVWFICVSANAKRLEVEVSRPKPFTEDHFVGFFDRIFVADKDIDLMEFPTAPAAEDIVDEPEILISKK